MVSRDFILGIQIRSLSNDEGDGNEDGKKAIGLDWQNVHHAFVYISLPSMHDYDLRRSYFTFHVSLFLFLSFSAKFRMELRKNFPVFDELGEVE